MYLPNAAAVILAATRNICHPAHSLIPGLTVHRRARVLATPAEAARPPWVVSTGIGGSPGPGGLGEVVEQVQAPPTSETIQRLIAQAHAYAKTVEDLAFMVWHGTERCTCDRRHPCERCRQANELLESLGFGERMREWAA